MGGESDALAFADTDAGLLQGGLFLASFDGGDATFHGTHAVQVFVQLVLIVLRQLLAKVSGASDNQIQHLSIQRIRLGDLTGLIGLTEEPVESTAGIGLGGNRLGGRTIAAVVI